MIAFDAHTDEQGRLLLTPTDSGGHAVTLDPGAFTVTVVSGNGTFEYNAATNGCVFRAEDDGAAMPVTQFHVEVDGQPGPGESFLPIDIEMRTIPAGAQSLGESILLEAKGTPA